MSVKHSVLLLIAIGLLHYPVRGQIISTFAGNGSAASSGDGGQATGASLNYPYNVATDTAGNVYISDIVNQSIRKVSSSGIITTICGTGSSGFSGDSGQATAAKVNWPAGMVIDRAGNLLFADSRNNRVRKIDPSGVITTIAGTGTASFSGDGGPATAATLSAPWGLAIDTNGSLFIADQANNRIRKVDTSGIMSTIAGVSSAGYTGDGGAATAAQLNGPYGVAADRSGFVYIADYNNNRVRKISLLGIISTYAGTGTAGFSGDGGPATAANVSHPQQLAVDGSGNLYIACPGAMRVRVVTPTALIYAFAGNGTAGFYGDGGVSTLANLSNPYGLAIDQANTCYIADAGNHRIRKVLPYRNSPVYFLSGHSLNLAVCHDTIASMDALLAVDDSDLGQTLTWDTVRGPRHGTVHANYSTSSTSGAVIPSGLTYQPNAGFSGYDTILLFVRDTLTADTATVFVHVTPQPNAGVISGPDSLCPGNTTTLTDTATGGTWVSDNSAIATVSSTGVVTAITPGIANIRYIAANVCGVDSASHLVSAYCPASVLQFANSVGEVKIYPNPVSQLTRMFRISSNKTEQIQLSIINATGIEVYRGVQQSNLECTLAISLPPGAYIFSLVGEDGCVHRQILAIQ